MVKTKASLIRKLAELMVESYRLEKDPLVINLNKVILAMKKNPPDWKEAEKWITNYLVETTIKSRAVSYSSLPAFKDLEKLYKDAVQEVKAQDLNGAFADITKIIDAHEKSQQEIDKLQGVGR